MTSQSFDPIWDEIYGGGHALNKYPWDIVVSFVFQNAPRSKPRKDIRILEIGCGAGSNLWFAAREGFQVTGVDGSAKAVNFAKHRFANDGLQGDFYVADFTKLPFPDLSFDLVIDRGSLTCCGLKSASLSVDEVHRVLVHGGRFLCNPYSDTHTSHRAGRSGPDGLTVEIFGGTLVGVGQICFYCRSQVEALLAGWNILSLKHLEIKEELEGISGIHSEWRAIAEKKRK